MRTSLGVTTLARRAKKATRNPGANMTQTTLDDRRTTSHQVVTNDSFMEPNRRLWRNKITALTRRVTVRD